MARNSSLGREMQRIMELWVVEVTINRRPLGLNQSTVSLVLNFNLFLFCFVKNKE